MSATYFVRAAPETSPVASSNDVDSFKPPSLSKLPFGSSRQSREIPKTEQVNQSIVSRRRARQPFASPLAQITTAGLDEPSSHVHHGLHHQHSPAGSLDHSHESADDFEADLSDGGGRSRSPRDFDGHHDKRVSYDGAEGGRPHSPSSAGGAFSSSLVPGSKRLPRALSKSSGFRGVSKCVKDGRWQSRIRVGHRVKYLGRFKTEAEAASRYDEAAIALHGSKATLNFSLSEKQMEIASERAKALRPKLGFIGSDFSDLQQETGDWHSDTSVPPSRCNSPTSSATSFAFSSTEDDRWAAMGLMSLRHSLPGGESRFMIVEEEEN